LTKKERSATKNGLERENQSLLKIRRTSQGKKKKKTIRESKRDCAIDRARKALW